MTALTGTGTLVRMALRRDRVMIPATIATFVAVVGLSAGATVGIYPTEQSRATAAELINATPALVALYGRIYDVTSLGAVSMLKLIGLGTAFVSVFTLLVVVRHTRADEEDGRTELAASGVVGRYAALAAALVVATSAALGLGLLTALALVAAGLPPGGAAAFGASWAGAGLVFAGVAAVAAQLTTSARAARGIASTVLVVAYVVRAAGDTAPQGSRWVSWLSPIGWAQQVRPFAGDRWAVVPLLVALSVALVLAAGALARRRDLGSGLLADRPGPARARPSLATPLALAWRLDRNALLGWTVGFVLLGLVLGNILSNVGAILDSPQSREMIRRLGGIGSLTDAFLSAELGFVALFASVFGISTVLRLRAEESAERAAPVLAAPVSRVTWAASHVLVALLGTTVITAAIGLSVGVAQAAQSGDSGDVGRDLAAALVRLPAIWVLVAVAVALYGVGNRLVPYAWGVLVLCVVVGQFGDLMDLPSWAQDVSPYTHVPSLPGAPLTAWPLLLLTAVALALLALGLAAFRRRDLAGD